MTLRILILVLLLAPLSACGVRGDLYLPEPGSAGAESAPAPTGDDNARSAGEDEPGEPDGTER